MIFQDYEFLPETQQDTYEMLKCAFPEGVTDAEYTALLAILYPYMSHRSLARVVAYFIGRRDHTGYVHVLHDVYGVEWGDFPDTITEKMRSVRHRLSGCGFQEWAKKMEAGMSDLPPA